jgi:hypothetical protein
MATSKGRRGATSGDSNASSASENDVSQPTRSRRKRSGGATKRREKNEPGQYQKRGDEPDFESASDDDLMPASASGLAPRTMESAFDDDDLDADALYEYEMDEGDGDIDWDDSIPARGGGKSPDK